MDNKTPESCREAYRHWLKFFGPPQSIALDLGREFAGSFTMRAETDGTFLDPASLESPYQRGITERGGKTFKLMLSKAMEQYECKNLAEWRELVDVVNFQKNRLLMRNGYSPIQRVIGYTPKLPGGLLSGDAANRAFPDKVRLGDEGVTRAMQMRKAASIAFHATECEDALRRAISSGPRPFQNFEVGEAVYFWRVGQGSTRKPAPAYWHGPARVVMTDPPTTLWLSYQGTLVKASPERVRRSSEEEQLTLTGWIDDVVQTRQSLDQERKRGFLDLSDEPLPPVEPDQDHEDDAIAYMAVNCGRFRVQQPDLQPEHQGEELPGLHPERRAEPEGGLHPDLRREPVPMEEDNNRSTEDREEGSGIKRDANEDFKDEHDTKRLRTEYLEVYMLKVASLIQSRQKKEVKINEMSKYNKDKFLSAVAKEIKNNIDIGTYSPMTLEESASVRRDNPERIMSSRYVYTAKPLEAIDVPAAKMDGLLLEWNTPEPHKAKAAAGKLRGDVASPTSPSNAPVENTSQETEAETLSECPHKESAMAWGYEASRADPCLFYLFTEVEGKKKLSGIIAMATDDLLHGGDEEHIKRMEELKTRYKMGKFQFDNGRFCGKNFNTQPDGSVLITQEHFVQEKIAPIKLTAERRKQRYSKCNAEEIAALRGLLGSLSWLAKETRPDIAGRVALLQQTLPVPRVRDIIEANLTAAEAYKHSNSGIRIMPIDIENLRVGVVSDASWGNSQGQKNLETDDPDYWEETPTHWIRHHVATRTTTFHPAATETGPDIHDLLPGRTTTANGQTTYDDWTTARGVTTLGHESWVGTTKFEKQPNGQKLSHDNINELFLQLLNTSSQGGSILMYYDKNLEDSQEPQKVSISSWKSTRLKRKTVNTLSAECQSMVYAVGMAHWHRFLLVEALGHNLQQEDWERALSAVPYVAVTDSKSLFDCLNKTVCAYTQADDKRTAIDIAILKDDLGRSGGHPRWIEGSNMLADPLTKKMRGDFLRGAASESGVASSLEPRGQSNKFLVEILRPIYHVVFNEHYDRVAIKYDEKDNNKPLDDKKLRKGYDTYLPADSANYDDWNELVMDVDRLLELELDDGLQPFGFLRSIRRDRLYGQLRDVPWKEVLCNAKVKTHRELHSWWGVFAATHRLWFLHLLLFLLCIFWASDKNYPHGKGWNVLLAGNDMTTCLSCVLMVVPLHIFAWKMSCWFTTGSALRRCRCTGEVLGPLFWSSTVFFSCLTFFWVRYVDAMDQDEAWSYGGVQLPFAAHVLVCCLGLFAILFQPGEHGKGNLSQVAASRPSTKLLRYIFWLSVMAVKVLASYNGVWAVETAMRELKKMSRPGRESLDDLPKFAFGPNWDKDMIQWLAIWGTSFVCFLADTQFWFVVGCTVLGFFLGCAERGWYLKSFVSEDALAKVAKRFSRRVALSEWNPDAVDRNQLLEKASIPLKSEVADQDYIPKERAENRTMSKFFPPVWDLIIDIMQCEDKLDPAAAAQLKFSVPLEDQDAPPPPAAPAAAAPDAAAPARQADAAVQTTAMQAAERVS
eukprot:s2718_g1.t2